MSCVTLLDPKWANPNTFLYDTTINWLLNLIPIKSDWSLWLVDFAIYMLVIHCSLIWSRYIGTHMILCELDSDTHWLVDRDYSYVVYLYRVYYSTILFSYGMLLGPSIWILKLVTIKFNFDRVSWPTGCFFFFRQCSIYL